MFDADSATTVFGSVASAARVLATTRQPTYQLPPHPCVIDIGVLFELVDTSSLGRLHQIIIFHPGLYLFLFSVCFLHNGHIVSSLCMTVNKCVMMHMSWSYLAFWCDVNLLSWTKVLIVLLHANVFCYKTCQCVDKTRVITPPMANIYNTCDILLHTVLAYHPTVFIRL